MLPSGVIAVAVALAQGSLHAWVAMVWNMIRATARPSNVVTSPSVGETMTGTVAWSMRRMNGAHPLAKLGAAGQMAGAPLTLTRTMAIQLTRLAALVVVGSSQMTSQKRLKHALLRTRTMMTHATQRMNAPMIQERSPQAHVAAVLQKGALRAVALARSVAPRAALQSPRQQPRRAAARPGQAVPRQLQLCRAAPRAPLP
mmetsp:Transcript_70135/g.168122  ORF Transcript_70135/g.168122 Transcript_70135/m.168122 type:complete len:200 (+) Transcript_70135:143-742(+)